MSEKLTLTYVNRKQGTSKEGKPYEQISVKAKEYGDSYLSGFGNAQNKNWSEGDIVEVAEVKRVEKNGKTYLNLVMPKAQGASVDLTPVVKVLDEIRNLLRAIALKQGAISSPKIDRGFDYPDSGVEGEVNSEEQFF